ncbi:MAG: helix-turn-helix transcriptional regulator [Flavobacterium sp.]|nr:helix-turn-helix transcriptional regulator [Flavobacterium sp.]
MLNTADFVQKLEIILDYYQLNASTFADKIGVQRSSLSHLLSGRNKPSLEFVVKISEAFPEVDLYWFLLNKGSFPKNNNASTENSEVEKELTTTENPLKQRPDTKTIEKITNVESEIEKIVFFFKDGTFKSYTTNE